MIADDHAVVRTGLKLVLEAAEGVSVVAEAADVHAAKRIVAAHRPDLLVLDLNMPGAPSLPAIPELAQQTAVVVLTMQNDPAFAREALQSGALGYVLKEAADAELVSAVRAAAAGRTYLNPELGAHGRGAAGAGRTARRPNRTRARDPAPHSARAHNAEIGGLLFLSVRTIESHRAHIQQKTRLSTRAELVRYALDHGLLGD